MKNLNPDFQNIENDNINSDNLEKALEEFKDELDLRGQILKKLLEQINKDRINNDSDV